MTEQQVREREEAILRESRERWNNTVLIAPFWLQEISEDHLLLLNEHIKAEFARRGLSEK